MKRIALIFIIGRENKYSVNSLVGAIESFDDNFFDIFVVDYRKQDVCQGINRISVNYNTLVFAFSFMTHQYWDIKNLVEELKSTFRDAIFVCGGPHASGKPESVATLGFDYVFIGESEITFKNFFQNILNSMEGDLSKQGNKDGVSFITSVQFVNLNEFSPVSIKYNRFGPIEISRGCPYRCAYCQTPSIFGRNIRHRDIESVIDIVRHMVFLGMKDIRFIAPNAIAFGSEDGIKINLDKVENLLYCVRKEIGEDGRIFFGSFPSEIRPENISIDAIKLIKSYCNNKNIVIGAQSGSSRVLKLLKRGHTVEDVINAVDIIISNGLNANVDFIFGLPFEKDEDVEVTIKFISKLVKMGARIHGHYFLPLPGTVLERETLKIFEKYEDFIHKELLPNGHIFGNWERQKELSYKIHELLLY
ncbi:MAG: TIGR04013 family B12-binding domain/radical SAM domain-containing protein [Candidatus Marinimicrobia bacterium]|nr:TIGR04013 family B12-binding domain/radical SAM domain-containing protein [Candidatus Neomarinimicrobiota bacterium]